MIRLLFARLLSVFRTAPGVTAPSANRAERRMRMSISRRISKNR
jgi:hypothetical protein